MLTEALLSSACEAAFRCLVQQVQPKLLEWLKRYPVKVAFQRALAGALLSFARQYPEYATALFDVPFLCGPGVCELAKLLQGAQAPDPAILAQLWEQQLPHVCAAELTEPAADFLFWLTAEAKAQPALAPFFDGNAIERVNDSAEGMAKLRADIKRVLIESQRYQITLDKAQGVVIGDLNQVTQVFHSYYGGDYASLDAFYILPDAVFQRVDVNHFTGREWLTAQLDAFLSRYSSGVFLLVGEAGVGKTSFLAHLVRQRRYLHFFAEQAPGDSGVSRAIQSLAAQLVARYRLEPAFSRDSLPFALSGYPDFLDRYLRMAAGKLSAGERLIIVIDALDEAGSVSGGNVLGLPRVLPPGVFLILAQRPVTTITLRIEPTPTQVNLDAGSSENLGDMRTYLEAVATRPAIAGQLSAQHYSASDLVDTLLAKSGGVWMYLHYVLEEVERGQRAPLDLAQLPAGLAAYYASYWEHWRVRPNWEELYAPMLASLTAAAHEFVTAPMLLAWSKAKATPLQVQRLLGYDWKAFITSNRGAYRLYHASLRDFLSGKPTNATVNEQPMMAEMAVRTREMHGRIVDYYQSSSKGEWLELAGMEGGYGLYHLAEHLAGAERWRDLHELVAEGVGERQAWAWAHHAVEGSYREYLTDLGLAWKHCNELNLQTAISQQVRYALIESSIHALAENISTELLKEVLVWNLPGWTPRGVLGSALQISNAGRRSITLRAIASHLPLELQPVALAEALGAALAIEHKPDRAQALQELALQLSSDLRAEALRQAYVAAKSIEDASGRARILQDLAPHLPPDSRAEAWNLALTAAKTVEYKLDRARILQDLAPHLPLGLQADAWKQALAAARAIEDEEARARVLEDLAQHLPPDLRRDVLRGAFDDRFVDPKPIGRAVNDGRAHQSDSLRRPLSLGVTLRLWINVIENIQDALTLARVLQALKGHELSDLSAEDWGQVLAAARAIKVETDRVHALRQLASTVPPELQAEAWKQALTAAKAIRDDEDRVHALRRLASEAPPELQAEAWKYAIAAARTLRDDEFRAWVLQDLALHVPSELNAGEWKLALNTIQGIRDEATRARVLQNIAFDVPPGLQTEAWNQALVAAEAIRDATTRVQILQDLALDLPRELQTEGWSQAVAAGWAIVDEMDRVHALRRLASEAPPELQAEAWKQAVAAAGAAKDSSTRARALQELARDLPLGLQSEAWKQALAAAKSIQGETNRAQVLQDLALDLPRELQAEAWKQAYVAAQAIWSDRSRARVLQDLAPHLPPELRAGAWTQALAAARAIGDGAVRVRVMQHLAPFLPAGSRADVVAAQGISARPVRVRATRNYALHLSPNALAHALAATQAITSGAARARALRDLAPQWAGWVTADPIGASEAWPGILRAMAADARPDFLESLDALIPVLIAFGDGDAAAEITRAITDAGRWWP